MKVRVAEQVDVVARPEVLWGAVVDWEGQSEWVVMTTVRVVAGTGSGVGERIEAVTGVGWLVVRDPMEVVRFEPPRRVDVAHRGRVLRGTGTFLVEPVPGGARFTWVEDLDVPFGVVGRMGAALALVPFRLLLRRSLRRLARRLEGRRSLGR